MKKLLALVLALVMSMSLVTISNAAFKDADKIDNKEAVDVMAAVGVLAGYTDGNFGAKDTLTRAQACKIVAYLDLGGDVADALVGTGKAFSDVKATAWYAGYVEYCAGAGYVAGIGGGKFDPDAKVTGVQFAKMLLCALGYRADIQGYNGSDWSLNIAKDANSNKLFKELSIAASAALTREQAAQMAFNTLKANVVEYEGGTNISTSDGTKVVIDAKLKTVANDLTDDYRNTDKDEKQQLVEKLYSKLSLTVNDTDALNRPAHSWTFKGNDVGTYSDTADYRFVANKSQTLADSIKKILNKSNFMSGSYYVNGNDTAVAAATNLKVGDVVELFMKEDGKTVDTATVIRYSVDEVTGAVETSSKDGKDYVKVPGVTGKLETKYVKGYEGLQKDDYVYFYKTNDGTHDTYNLFKAGSFEGKLTETKLGSVDKYVIGDTEYVANGNINPTINVYNTLYTYYTDANGYIIAAVEKEEAKSDYVAIQYAANKNNGGGVSASTDVEARLVKVDGTVLTGIIAKIDGTNATETMAQGFSTASGTPKFFTYTLNSDKEYELKTVVIDNGTNTAVTNNSIAKKASSLNNTYIVNDKTVFVVAKDGSKNNAVEDTYKYVTYTGKANLPAIDSASYVVAATDKGVATYVLVYAYTGTPVSSGNAVLFVKGSADSTAEVKKDGTTTSYSIYTVIADAKVTTVKVKTGSGIAQGKLMTPAYDGDGYVTSLADKSSDATYKKGMWNASLKNYQYTDGTLRTNAGIFTCADDVLVVVNNGGDITETTAGAYSFDKDDVHIDTYVILTNTSDNTVKYVLVVETEV